MTPCNHCGKELPDVAQFCAHCGTARPQLPERFAQVQKRYAQLRGELDAGTLGADGFEKALGDLAFEYQGHYWTIGAATGAWFMHDGKQWAAKAPPVAAPAPAPVTAPALAGVTSAQKVDSTPQAVPQPARLGPWRYVGLIGFGLAAVAIVLPWYLDVSYYIGPDGSRFVLPAALFGAYGLSRKTTGMLTLATVLAGAVIVGWALVASTQDEFSDSEEGVFLILVAGLAAVAGSVRHSRAARNQGTK